MTRGKELRVDARRNRERILAAAETVFAARGTSASTEDVAAEAEVGIATVFRHFPTKEALLSALVVGRLQGLTAEAERLATEGNAGEGFFDFLRHAVAQSATKSAFVEALAAAGINVKSATAEVGRGLLDAIGALLLRAQHAGTVRKDVAVPEVMSLIAGLSRAAEHASADRDTQARVVALMLDGLRPAGASRPRLSSRTPRR